MDGVRRDQILGTWNLISFDLVRDEDPEPTRAFHVLGPTPLGRITFTEEGFMNVTVTNPDHANPLPTTWLKGSEKDIAFVARPMMTYCGPYKVYLENGQTTVSTTVEIALDPSWIGTEQVRRVSLVEEAGKQTLVLKPKQFLPMPDGKPGKPVLTWEKMKFGEN